MFYLNKLITSRFNRQSGIETRATQSVRVPVRNLRRADPSLNVDRLQESLGWEFLRTNVDGVDGGLKAAYNQVRSTVQVSWTVAANDSFILAYQKSNANIARNGRAWV